MSCSSCSQGSPYNPTGQNWEMHFSSGNIQFDSLLRLPASNKHQEASSPQGMTYKANEPSSLATPALLFARKYLSGNTWPRFLEARAALRIDLSLFRALRYQTPGTQD